MRGEQRGLHVDTVRGAETARYAQQLELVGGIEPVARLDFHGSHAFVEQALQPRLALAQQLFFGCRARSAHGCLDAAALARDVFVACAGQSPLELARAIARVDEMRVAVDQSRCQPASPAVELLVRAKRRRQVLARADPRDAAVAHGKRAIADCAAGRPAGHRRESGVDDQQVAIGH